ncbi:MAG: hypothetical protein IK070_02125 [Clostridia bacterium]|nr:hypothetical protein [Clostridia bacterium]
MKESRRHFVQWVALSLSLAVVVAFFVVLFTTVTVPYRKATYWYEEMQGEYLVRAEFELLNSSKAETRLFVDGEMVISYKGDFKVEKGMLYAKTEDAAEFEEVGTINADELYMADDDLTLTCPSTATLRTICIVFLSVFGATALGSVVWIVLDRKGSKVVLTEAVDVEETK